MLEGMRPFLVLTICLWMSACTSTPSIDPSAISTHDAEQWLSTYCSKFDVRKASGRELSGDLVMRSNTREFRGQYPAGLHFDRNGNFTMEVTNIIGGTMMRMTGDSRSIAIQVPSKPQYNRKNVTRYLGLEWPILAQLLHGDLPCPTGTPKVQVEGSTIVLQTPTWKWIFERATPEEGSVPVEVRLVTARSTSNQTILLTIEDWDRDQTFAKKVIVKSPDGELKWTWRSREIR